MTKSYSLFGTIDTNYADLIAKSFDMNHSDSADSVTWLLCIYFIFIVKTFLLLLRNNFLFYCKLINSIYEFLITKIENTVIANNIINCIFYYTFCIYTWILQNRSRFNQYHGNPNFQPPREGVIVSEHLQRAELQTIFNCTTLLSIKNFCTNRTKTASS